MTERQHAYSIGELLRNRMGEDRWHLALVQRSEVWDVDRMRQLLDSLLVSYPVGALLLCRTRQDSKVITRHGGETQVVAAASGAWQLLDGQQRLNALHTMLTNDAEKHEQYGRFYLDLTCPRQVADISEGGRTAAHIKYLLWREGEQGPSGQGPYDDFPERDRSIALSNWYEWTGRYTDEELRHRIATGDPADIARSLDPMFTASLTGAAQNCAARWLEELARIWTSPVLPVMYAEVDDPLDVLELFTRFNRAGVPFKDADIYFAAVKTFWNEAEPSLQRVVEAATPVLSIDDALRVVSRTASRVVGRADPIPLQVSRITGAHRVALVDSMGQLTAPGSIFLSRLSSLYEALRNRSRLHFGLRVVDRRLWDDVIVWATTTTTGVIRDEDISRIDSYLFGATLFSYRQVFGDAFSRLAFTECLAAGVHDEPFPLERILAVTRARYPGLRRGRRTVAPLWEPAVPPGLGRLPLADGHALLLLAVAQRIDPTHQPALDLDHIYASALATHMQLGRSHHADRWRVNSVGNLWLLDARVNRALQKIGPAEKFQKLREWQAAPEMQYFVWPDEHWSLTTEDQSAFGTAATALASLPTDLTQRSPALDEAMSTFAAVVHNRAVRLLEGVLTDLPDILRFAPHAQDESETSVASGFEAIEPRSIDAQILTTLQERLGIPSVGAHSLAEKWHDRAKEIEWAFKDATSRQSRRTEPARRNAPRIWHDSDPGSSGFSYFRELPSGFVAPASYFRVGYSAWFDASALLWFWISSNQAARLDAAELLLRAGIRSVSDARGIRVPIELKFHLHWEELAHDIDAQLSQIRRALGDPCLTPPTTA